MKRLVPFFLLGLIPLASGHVDPASRTTASLPDRIVLTWSGDPATSQAVTWRSSETLPGAAAQLQRATDGPLPKIKEVRAAESEFMEFGGLGTHYHRVQFQDLEPETLYAYRVGSRDAWSEWFHFRTASRTPKPFSFLYLGDAQVDLRMNWSRVIREAFREAPRASFALHVGDLVDISGSDHQWSEWHGAAGWINATIPVLAVPGNHEYQLKAVDEATGTTRRILDPHWKPQFTFPGNGPEGLEETCYYTDYQGVRFVLLDSNRAWERQAIWLRGVLADNPNRWTILAFHHPVMNTARWRIENGEAAINRGRDAWKPLIDEFKVDLVLSGHDHTYARSGLENNLVGSPARRDSDSGTVYVISVSGTKMYDIAKADWMVRSAEDTQLYQVISINGDTLTFEAWTAANRLHDKFRLSKQDGAPNLLEELLSEDGGPQPSGKE